MWKTLNICEQPDQIKFHSGKNEYRLNSRNACYYSVLDFFVYQSQPKNRSIKLYRTVTSTFVLYGCETWSLTLMLVQRLRVFENRVLREIIGPKRDEKREERRKLHNKELHGLYSSPNIIRMIKSRRLRWVVYVARSKK